MIQKAIVESIENNYQVKVRIPKYDKMSSDGFSYDELSTSIICSTPGTLVTYSVGDIVLVGFENNEISKPVVLGLLYTENNTGDTIKFPEISSELDKVSQSLKKLTTANSFIHIKYSNDGGNTFTSLYDYSEEKYDEDTKSYYASNIELNPKSRYLAWNVLTAQKQNALDNINIKTTVKAIFSDSESEIEFTDKAFDLPDNFYYSQKLLLSYEMQILQGDKSDYNIALFSDRNELGSVEGDYIGFYYSTTPNPSSNPIDYTWASIKVRIQKFIDEAYNNLLKRVQANERYLYGAAQEDAINSEIGLNSALQVGTSLLNVSSKPRVQLTTDKKMIIDTKNNYLFFNNIALTATNNGHLKIIVKDINSN